MHGQILPPVENSFGAVRNLEAWGKTKSLEGHTCCFSRLFRAECCLIVLLTFTISWMKFFCNIRQSKLATSMDKGTGKIKQNWMFSKVLGKTCMFATLRDMFVYIWRFFTIYFTITGVKYVLRYTKDFYRSLTSISLMFFRLLFPFTFPETKVCKLRRLE